MIIECMQSFDIETGSQVELLNLNPEGWVEGVSNERNWGMMYGMDVSWHRNMILAGDSLGCMHSVDPRANRDILGKFQWHKKGNKVSSLPKAQHMHHLVSMLLHMLAVFSRK